MSKPSENTIAWNSNPAPYTQNTDHSIHQYIALYSDCIIYATKKKDVIKNVSRK